jgi:hypothetical protein
LYRSGLDETGYMRVQQAVDADHASVCAGGFLGWVTGEPGEGEGEKK